MKNKIDINKELNKLKNNPVANLVIGSLISKSNNNTDKEIGYTGEKCINCGRVRVIKFESGKRICEKCSFDQDKKEYVNTFDF